MAILTALNVIPKYVTGDAAMIGLFALRNVNTGDTIDLATVTAPQFQQVFTGVVLGQSSFVEIAATFVGTVVTMPAGLVKASGLLLVIGC